MKFLRKLIDRIPFNSIITPTEVLLEDGVSMYFPNEIILAKLQVALKDYSHTFEQIPQERWAIEGKPCLWKVVYEGNFLTVLLDIGHGMLATLDNRGIIQTTPSSFLVSPDYVVQCENNLLRVYRLEKEEKL